MVDPALVRSPIAQKAAVNRINTSTSSTGIGHQTDEAILESALNICKGSLTQITLTGYA